MPYDRIKISVAFSKKFLETFNLKIFEMAVLNFLFTRSSKFRVNEKNSHIANAIL